MLVQWLLISSRLPGSAHRRLILRLFGARVGRGVVVKPGARIKFPWRLSIGDHSWIGEDAWIDNLAPVAIGADCCLFPRRLPVHRQPRLVAPLLRSPHQADRGPRRRLDRCPGRRRTLGRRGRSALSRQHGDAGSHALAGPYRRAGATGCRAAGPARSSDSGARCGNVTDRFLARALVLLPGRCARIDKSRPAGPRLRAGAGHRVARCRRHRAPKFAFRRTEARQCRPPAPIEILALMRFPCRATAYLRL